MKDILEKNDLTPLLEWSEKLFPWKGTTLILIAQEKSNKIVYWKNSENKSKQGKKVAKFRPN